MFTVNYNNHEYAFSFTHDWDAINLSGQMTGVRVTRCFLDIDGEHRHDIVGEAFCSPKDIFQKAKGRKEAFSRCLELLRFPEKETREFFWQEYFRHNKKPVQK